MRTNERVTFDSMRLAQTGCWTGSITVDGEVVDVTPDRWWGSRDRSWGVRPVGEPEPAGINAARPMEGFWWVYAPMQFERYSILCMAQEEPDGTRVLEQAIRLWPDGRSEDLGKPRLDAQLKEGTRQVERATWHLHEPDGTPLTIEVEVLLPMWLGKGTGYGFDADWRHGMYQGALKVEGLTLDLRDPETQSRLFGLVDHVARYEWDGRVGWGLFEVGFFGPHEQYGFKDWGDVAT
jgi:hypothetical protein